jgi:hypothetical protein
VNRRVALLQFRWCLEFAFDSYTALAPVQHPDAESPSMSSIKRSSLADAYQGECTDPTQCAPAGSRERRAQCFVAPKLAGGKHQLQPRGPTRSLAARRNAKTQPLEQKRVGWRVGSRNSDNDQREASAQLRWVQRVVVWRSSRVRQPDLSMISTAARGQPSVSGGKEKSSACSDDGIRPAREGNAGAGSRGTGGSRQ